MSERSSRAPAPSGPAFWIGALTGGAIMAFGVIGLLANADETKPGSWLKYLLGGLVAHDLLLAPAVALLGAITVRVVPAAVRPTLVGTSIVAASLVLVSIPVLTGNGRNPTNPSLLPHDYSHNLTIVLAIVAAAGALIAAVRFRVALKASKRRQRAGSPVGNERDSSRHARRGNISES